MRQLADIILASGSPRRRELLTQAGLSFRVMTSDADEATEQRNPKAVVEDLSRRKGKAVFDRLYSGEEQEEGGAWIVVSADTIVALDGEILGKPGDPEDAVRMLTGLSGRSHEVYTGVTILAPGREGITFSDRTEVTFYPLPEREIRDYVSSGEPMDKAGAYGIQGLGARLVERIGGDYNNVVGFPLAHFLRVLGDEGYILWES